MSHLIEVAFRGNRKEFFLWDGDDPPRTRAAVIVEGDRGEDLGHVRATSDAAAQRFAGVAHGAAVFGGGTAALPTKRALRLASDDETRRAADLTEQNESARRRSIERVQAHNLVMKVSDAEWQWDHRKLTLYFTAEKRVDFRGLVRDLAALFRTRIELKQIGVRDEAKRLNGVGRCGREYCSASWLPELRPVNLSVAKDQHLSLNPTQISGACGRLMCSLRYEHEFYVQSRKRFPKEGRVLVTARGEEKVVANDIFRDRVTLRAPDGELRLVSLADLRAELETQSDDHEAITVVESGGSAIETTDGGDADRVAETDPTAADGARPRAERRRTGDSPPTASEAGDAADSEARSTRSLESPVGQAPDLAPVVTVSSGPTEAVTSPADATADATADADESAVTDGDGDGDAQGDDPTEEGGAQDAAKPRRRRGRRGGRRGRGGTTGNASAEDAPPPTEPSA